MAREESKTIAHRCVEEVWNRGNLDVVDELYGPDYVHHAYPDLPRGPAGYKEVVREFRGAFSDFRLTIEELIVEGDRSATRWRMRGTHDRAELMGIAPTGKEITLEGIVVARVADGKVVEEWEQFDALGLLRQLGAALPAGV